jgi:hypothetical protein
MLLNGHYVNEEIKREITKFLETNKNGKHNIPKSMGCSKRNMRREGL